MVTLLKMLLQNVNGILKEEYLNNYEVENYSQAKELLDAVIRIYNNERKTSYEHWIYNSRKSSLKGT